MKLTIISVLLWVSIAANSQELPEIKVQRAEEDYLPLLRNDSLRNANLLNRLKAIGLNPARDLFISLGGEFRPRSEVKRNGEWESEADESFYSHRVMLHSSFQFKDRVMVFGQLHHALITDDESYTQSDQLDVHQLFFQTKIFSGRGKSLFFRGGRQEILLGTGRLVSIRDGPNVRRSFDMGRLIFSNQRNNSLQLFVGREVKVPTDVFDNSSRGEPFLWGIHTSLQTPKILGATDLYIIGYHSNRNTYNQGEGEEIRHTIGMRRWGSLGSRFRYNTEIDYQFGSFADGSISAWAIEGDWHYLLPGKIAKDFGLKVDYFSGDRSTNDSRLGTFNPMYNNPGYFGLITQVSAMNLFDIHPSAKISISENISVTAEADFYWRAQRDDGVYNGGRSLIRESGDDLARSLGYQAGAKLDIDFSRHVTLSTETYYFVAGKFIEQTGQSENTFYNAVTLWLGF